MKSSWLFFLIRRPKVLDTSTDQTAKKMCVFYLWNWGFFYFRRCQRPHGTDQTPKKCVFFVEFGIFLFLVGASDLTAHRPEKKIAKSYQNSGKKIPPLSPKGPRPFGHNTWHWFHGMFYLFLRKKEKLTIT
jgi:hypothetical protein